MASDVPQMLLGDPYGLRESSNLTGNAVEFTERGDRIAVEARAEMGGELIVAVEDTGHGISPDAEAVLFEPFSQGDVSTTQVALDSASRSPRGSREPSARTSS